MDSSTNCVKRKPEEAYCFLGFFYFVTKDGVRISGVIATFTSFSDHNRVKYRETNQHRPMEERYEGVQGSASSGARATEAVG
ncbi:hypothetical protein AB9M62_06650 [Bacillales bacterium AN1005]